MLNSQIPYNQLPLIDEKFRNLQLDSDLKQEFWNSIYHLNGFIEASADSDVEQSLLLFQFADARNSFELEAETVSSGRFFEALSSENKLKDRISTNIIGFVKKYNTSKKISLSSLAPEYIYEKANDRIFRERKESLVKSFHTNLTLYSAPVNSFQLSKLKNELDELFKNEDQDSLELMCLLHHQIRAISPFRSFNHHVARTYTQLWLKQQGLIIQALPLSTIIIRNKEEYQTVLRNVIQSGDYTVFAHYLLEVMTAACRHTLKQLKEIAILRKSTRDMINKYTYYNLPAEELLPLLFNQPFIKAATIMNALDCHRHTAYVYLRHLVEMGILVEKISGREKLYHHRQLFDILTK